MVRMNGLGNPMGCVETVACFIGQCEIHGANFQDYDRDDEKIPEFVHTNLLK
jgi:hypothetical protein